MKVEDFYDVCRLVIKYCPTGFAVAHAAAGLSIKSSAEIATRAEYLLHSIADWTSPLATHCRDVLTS